MLSLDDESFMQDGVLGEDDDDSFVNFLEYIDETIQNAKKEESSSNRTSEAFTQERATGNSAHTGKDSVAEILSPPLGL